MPLNCETENQAKGGRRSINNLKRYGDCFKKDSQA